MGAIVVCTVCLLVPVRIVGQTVSVAVQCDKLRPYPSPVETFHSTN